jgi:amino acid transporter
MAFAMALVFAELGALVNSSGALAQIPLLTHGRTSGFIGGWCAWIAYVSLPTIEVLALLQYMASSFPLLTLDNGQGQVLSPLGLVLATALLILFTVVNLTGVKTLARWIDWLTAWKLVVPLLVSSTLMWTASHWSNLSANVPQTGSLGDGVVAAISTGGVLFSLLGFRTAMDLAGEARRPQRDIPMAMILGLGISLAIYLTLQLAFLVAVGPDQIGAGWRRLSLAAHGGPLVAIALGLGMGWVVELLLTDAVISPSATALAFMGVSARVSWMMGQCGVLPRAFSRLNRNAVPWFALFSSLAIGVTMLFAGPSWQRVVTFLTATLVIALAMGPVSLMALRHQAPRAPRPFRLPWAAAWCATSFVFSSWAAFWCGVTSLEGALLAVLVPALIFMGLQWRAGRPMQAAHGLWWFAYMGGLLLLSELMSLGGPLDLPFWVQLIIVAAFALALFPLAIHSRLKQISEDAQLELGVTQISPAGSF